MLCIHSEGALMCKSLLSNSLIPLSIKQIDKYSRKREIPQEDKTQSNIPLAYFFFFFLNKFSIGQGDTTSKASRSPLNLSFGSLIVSYSSHV